jgi:hypothetical protein
VRIEIKEGGDEKFCKDADCGTIHYKINPYQILILKKRSVIYFITNIFLERKQE